MLQTIREQAAAAAAVFLVAAGTLAAQPPAGAPAAGAPGGGAPGFSRTPPPNFDFADNKGFTSLFDGTLNGWDYDHNLWDIKDGSIHLASTCEKPTGTVYAVAPGEYGDFILKYEFKGTGRINSGMQFRSYIAADPNATGTKFPARQRPAGAPGGPGAGGPGGAGAARPAGAGGPGAGGPGGAAAAGGPPRAARQPACANPGTAPSRESEAKWDMAGPQADFDEGNNFSAMNYEQGGRGIIATPGYSLYADANGTYVMSKIAEKAELDSWFHKDDWNQFMIVCMGHSTSIYMNGHLVTQFIDDNPKYFRSSGKFGIEAESSGDIYARNISVEKLD